MNPESLPTPYDIVGAPPPAYAPDLATLIVVGGVFALIVGWLLFSPSVLKKRSKASLEKQYLAGVAAIRAAARRREITQLLLADLHRLLRRTGSNLVGKDLSGASGSEFATTLQAERTDLEALGVAAITLEQWRYRPELPSQEELTSILARLPNSLMPPAEEELVHAGEPV